MLELARPKMFEIQFAAAGNIRFQNGQNVPAEFSTIECGCLHNVYIVNGATFVCDTL